MADLQQLRQELYYAREGLEQMQAPGAGYDEHPEQLERDVRSQVKAIGSLERKISKLSREKELA